HARTTDDGGRRTRRRRPEWKCGGFREAGQALVDSAVSSFVEHIRKRLVSGADYGTNSARGNSVGGAATFYESSVQSIPLSSCRHFRNALPRSGENDRRDVLRARQHGNVTRRQRRDLGVDLLRHRALDIGLDHPVLFRDDVPGRLRLPRGVGHLLVEGLAEDGPLRHGHHFRLRGGQVRREVVGDSLGGQIEVAGRIGIDAGESGWWRRRLPEVVGGLAHVRRERGDVHQRGDLVARSCLGDHGAAPRVANQDDGPFLRVDRALCCSHIIRERGERFLFGEDVQTYGSEQRNIHVTTRYYYVVVVSENHRLFMLTTNYLYR